MHIVTLLGPLEKLETQLSDLYKLFSETFRDDEEASIFFDRMSTDEKAHADLVRFERRLVTGNKTIFKEVEADIREIEKISASLDLLLKSAQQVSVEKALEISIAIENSVCEQHYINAITLSNPDVTRLIRSLVSFDCRHFLAFEDFARKRGLDFQIKKNEYIASCRQSETEKKQRSENEPISTPLPADISQQFIDTINHLYKWHESMGYYKLLGVSHYATEQEIRESYHQMAKEFQPDRHMGLSEDLKEKLNTIFSSINSAYSILADSKKRIAYDRTMRLGGK